MKLKAHEVDRFLAAPLDPALRLVLVYGEDEGLIRERAISVLRKVIDDLQDPFRAADLGPAELKDDPARLADEAAALSLTGGRRAIRLRDAGDALRQPIANLLDHGQAEALVVAEAGSLSPRSKLRKLVEEHKHAIALPCFADSGRDLERVIRDGLTTHGLSASPEALAYLVAHLGADRMITRQELEKLALYGLGRDRLDLADVTACIGDNAARHFDDAVQAAALGDLPGVDRALTALREAGQSPVGVLRIAMTHFQKLHLVTTQIAHGVAADRAMGQLRPPLRFRAADRFKAQLGRWQTDTVERALALLLRAEKECKGGVLPADITAARALMKIAGVARRAGRGRSPA